jgi:soluble lytic murein transglycosylase-like protein
MSTNTNQSTVTPLIMDAASRYGVPPELALAVAQQESGFNQGARSGAGAIGVFQLMPATAAGLGVDPFDLWGNIEGGVKYLAQMLKQFGGDTTLALAAYNAGPGNVAKYGGVPPFEETQNYVASILAKLGVSNVDSFSGSDSGSDSVVDGSTNGFVDPLLVGLIGAVVVGALVLGNR